MQPMDIAVRAYVIQNKASEQQATTPAKKHVKRRDIPSDWVLIFDAETTTDASQKLRFGTYQVRKNEDLLEAGLFYDPDTLNEAEHKTLCDYAKTNCLNLLTTNEFIENVFYQVGYKYRASIVGFNLPFDLSRLSIDHSPARATKRNKIMQGGFSFKLSENPFNPRVQIKHVSSRDSFIQFAATKGQRTNKGDRKKQRWQAVRRGYFIDIKTLAAALTSTSHSLGSLAKALKTESQKHETEEHGGKLTAEYIKYALQDTQVTWESFCKLKSLYDLHGLNNTSAHKIHSEASLGKAYLREMGIKAWKQLQPDFPPDLIGKIMSTYYGGRSEVHIRRDITQVLYCDFLSMYPTVCTLMGLWSYVIAKGIKYYDTTSETQRFLENITISDLQNQDIWRSLCIIVQIMPDNDIFPIRAKYNDDTQYTIGTNYLSGKTPLWFTLADCISSKLLTGRSPKILQAISFVPEDIQEDLKPVNIAGNASYSVDPCNGDFFKQVIDLRTTIKKRIKSASDKETLESQQLALKILANATSYGIFVELNVEEEKELQDMFCYSASGQAIPIRQKKYEASGAYFHPLLATLITGAARLMLSITEYLAKDTGLDWAFCDTDSMAIAKPKSMKQSEFIEKARNVQEWFTPLNPYSEKAPLLKIEEYNYDLSGNLQPLYCYAISSKRYALFNIENNNPILRKISAHGLGHLIAPYHKDNILKDVPQWQYDFWHEIIQSAITGKNPDFAKLNNFNIPAISRYSATTPALEKWFKAYNKDKPYSDKVRPFNFLLAMQAQQNLKSLKPVAPYDRNPEKLLLNCFDRTTGKKVNKSQLKTALDVLAQYHLHPESKFLNGNYLDKGQTERRHITARAIKYIGKEANKWEEQYYTGADREAQTEYGICPEQKSAILETITQAITKYGVKQIAKYAKLSIRHISKIYHKQANPSDATISKINSAIRSLELADNANQDTLKQINKIIKAKNISIRQLARESNIDASNLAKLLAGKRTNRDLLKQIYKNILP